MKDIKSYMIIGILIVSVLGTLFHFVYNWSGDNIFVGLFTPINESIWEHTKLIYFPMLIYSSFLNRKFKHIYPCISSAMTSGALLGVLLIIMLFYTYSGIIGYNVAFVDISIFYISVLISFYTAYKLILSGKAKSYKVIFQILNILMICLYIIFTVVPPQIPLFISP